MSATSALYFGTVQHRRNWPVSHLFRYRVAYLYLDLSELQGVFRRRWLWSVDRSNVVAFHRSDHLGDPAVPLDASVRDLVTERIGRRPEGPIRLLTHPRQLGYVFNPVSFFYCWDRTESALEAIVAEVHNTPWGERHCYVLDPSRTLRPGGHRYRFWKAFHVSPFMAMGYVYDWRFTKPGPRLSVVMRNERYGRLDFEAALVLERRPLTGTALAWTLLRHSLLTRKVTAAIHWQALRLWWKGAPFHTHPAKREGAEGEGP